MTGNPSVIVFLPLFILCEDFGGGPVEVILPQHFVLDPHVLPAHPISRGTHGSPENLSLLLVKFVRPGPLAIGIVDAEISGRSVIVCELDLLLDGLRLLRGFCVGEIPCRWKQR